MIAFKEKGNDLGAFRKVGFHIGIDGLFHELIPG